MENFREEIKMGVKVPAKTNLPNSNANQVDNSDNTQNQSMDQSVSINMQELTKVIVDTIEKKLAALNAPRETTVNTAAVDNTAKLEKTVYEAVNSSVNAIESKTDKKVDQVQDWINKANLSVNIKVDSAKNSLHNDIASAKSDITKSISTSEGVIKQTVRDNIQSMSNSVTSAVASSVRSGLDSNSQYFANSISSKLNASALSDLTRVAADVTNVAKDVKDATSKVNSLSSTLNVQSADQHMRTLFVLWTVLFAALALVSTIFFTHAYLAGYDNNDLLIAAFTFLITSIVVIVIFIAICSDSFVLTDEIALGIYCAIEIAVGITAFILSMVAFWGC